MNGASNNLNCQLGCWGLAAAAALLATALLLVLGGYSWPGAIFLGALVFVVLGVLFSWLFCRPLPAAGEMHYASRKPAAQAPKASGTAPAAAAAPASVTPAASPAAPKPAAASPAAPADAGEGTRPAALTAPRDGKADDLKQIKGVGPKMERLCNELGFYHFDQIAAWTADEVAWVDNNLQGFKGRVSRDNWVDQARTLASGDETEFSKRVQDGGVY